jgi:formate/nitrite transporter FocA (FNT family)
MKQQSGILGTIRPTPQRGLIVLALAYAVGLSLVILYLNRIFTMMKRILPCVTRAILLTVMARSGIPVNTSRGIRTFCILPLSPFWVNWN